jgi:hypothetical protein
MKRDCTVFHPNCGPLGPFLNCRHLAFTRWRSMTRARTSCPNSYLEPYRGPYAAKVTNLFLTAA